MFAQIKKALSNTLEAYRAKLHFEDGLSEEQLIHEERLIDILIERLLSKCFSSTKTTHEEN